MGFTGNTNSVSITTQISLDISNLFFLSVNLPPTLIFNITKLYIKPPRESSNPEGFYPCSAHLTCEGLITEVLEGEGMLLWPPKLWLMTGMTVELRGWKIADLKFLKCQ